MTAINFPSSPVNGQKFTVGDKVYIYDTSKSVWKLEPNPTPVVGGITTGKAIAMAIVFGG